MASAGLRSYAKEGCEPASTKFYPFDDGMQSSLSRRNQQSTSSVRFGSTYSLATLTGSTSNLLDQTRLMSMQEDAHCRRITVEVMKRCLYKSVVPSRRRAVNRLGSISVASAVSGPVIASRLTMSVPATPIRSKAASPALSPTGSCNFFSPMMELADGADYKDQGLTSLFRPCPRYIRASCSQLDNLEDDLLGGITGDKRLDGSDFLKASRIC